MVVLAFCVEYLKVNTTLESLDVSDADLTIESVIALATVLRNNKSLKFLYINRPILFTHQEEPTVHFAKMLKVSLVAGFSSHDVHIKCREMNSIFIFSG